MDGAFKVGEEVADKTMARHTEGTEGVTLADGTEGQRKLNIFRIKRCTIICLRDDYI